MDQPFDTKKDYETEVQTRVSQLEDFNEISERVKVINDYTSYMGVIDESFRTLINPRVLGPHNFWRVLDCYTRAYLYIVQSVLYFERKDKWLKENPKSSEKFQLTIEEYRRILESPQSVQGELGSSTKRSKICRITILSCVKSVREETFRS